MIHTVQWWPGRGKSVFPPPCFPRREGVSNSPSWLWKPEVLARHPKRVATDTLVEGARIGGLRWRRWGVRALVALSLLWTVINWSGIAAIKDRVHEVPAFVIAAAASEILFNVGLLMMAAAAGTTVLRGDDDAGCWARVRQARTRLRTLLATETTRPLYKVGLNLNWFGAAMTTGIVPAIAIIWLLPFRNWPLLVIPSLDLVATFAIRMQLRPRPHQRVAVT